MARADRLVYSYAHSTGHPPPPERAMVSASYGSRIETKANGAPVAAQASATALTRRFCAGYRGIAYTPTTTGFDPILPASAEISAAEGSHDSETHSSEEPSHASASVTVDDSTRSSSAPVRLCAYRSTYRPPPLRSGIAPPATRLTDAALIRSASRTDDGRASSTGGATAFPDATRRFSSSILATDSSMRDSGIPPLRTAASTASKAASCFSAVWLTHRISAPASTALTAAFS